MRPGVLRQRVDATAWTIGCAGAAGTLAGGDTFWITAGLLIAVLLPLGVELWVKP